MIQDRPAPCSFSPFRIPSRVAANTMPTIDVSDEFNKELSR